MFTISKTNASLLWSTLKLSFLTTGFYRLLPVKQHVSYQRKILFKAFSLTLCHTKYTIAVYFYHALSFAWKLFFIYLWNWLFFYCNIDRDFRKINLVSVPWKSIIKVDELCVLEPSHYSSKTWKKSRKTYIVIIRK